MQKNLHNDPTLKLTDYLKGGYILVADDMSNMRKTIRNMLRQLGLNDVVESDDGDTALKYIKENEPGNCLFVLLDWNMPRMSGIHTARELRADPITHNLPILLIAADASSERVAQAWELGVNGFITKPFTGLTLGHKMVAIMEARSAPPSHVMLLKQGEALAKAGNYDEALEKYEKARSIKDSSRVLVHMAETWVEKGDNAKAHEYYRKAIELNALYLKAYAEKADLHEKEGHPEKALDLLVKACAISPANAERHMKMGRLYLATGETEKAVESFTKAAGNDASKRLEAAETLLSAEKAKESEPFFRQCLKDDPDAVHLYVRLGIALRRQGRWKDAVTVYESALKVDRKNDAIYYNLARALIEGGENEKAKANLQEALKINPGMDEAKQELEALNKGRGRQLGKTAGRDGLF